MEEEKKSTGNEKLAPVNLIGLALFVGCVVILKKMNRILFRIIAVPERELAHRIWTQEKPRRVSDHPLLFSYIDVLNFTLVHLFLLLYPIFFRALQLFNPKRKLPSAFASFFVFYLFRLVERVQEKRKKNKRKKSN